MLPIIEKSTKSSWKTNLECASDHSTKMSIRKTNKINKIRSRSAFDQNRKINRTLKKTKHWELPRANLKKKRPQTDGPTNRSNDRSIRGRKHKIKKKTRRRSLSKSFLSALRTTRSMGFSTKQPCHQPSHPSSISRIQKLDQSTVDPKALRTINGRPKSSRPINGRPKSSRPIKGRRLEPLPWDLPGPSSDAPASWASSPPKR